ncbi:hypothetical protein LCGC14_3145670 [marine sediment metagenome]|uniref:Uncharacterized protein n=1 Tax=marine sediment metagenome TaxID=412755 RepID=A0A0F8WJM7_9ZZZZ
MIQFLTRFRHLIVILESSSIEDRVDNDMGELERAATSYIAAVMLGLMGLGAGLALLGVWLVTRTGGATSAGRE